MRRTCLLLAFLSVQSSADVGKTLNEDLSRFISSTKAELAQSFFGPRVVKKDVTKLNITEERNGEINFTGSSRSTALFRRSKDNFIVNGSKILQLRKKPFNTSNEKYFLDSVHEFSAEEGAILFKQTEWNNIFFLALCYRPNYCRVLMSHPATSITFQQRLTVQSTPTDIEFFVDDQALFLIVAGDPCKVYRWTGAYFDEHEELETSGARAVAAFRNLDTIIIVVAQSLPMKEVYSKVFVRRNRKTELIQMLQTKDASDVVPYSLISGNETLDFVFVLNNREESAIFWWNGREFSPWKFLPDIVGPGRVYVHTLLSDMFFFFVHKNKLNVYHPTEMTFDLIHLAEFDRDILDVDLREEVDQLPMLVLLKGSDSEPVLTITVISVDVKYIPLAENQVATDPVLQCLFQLQTMLNDRDAKLNESMFLSNEIGKKSRVMELESLTVAKLELKNFSIKELRVLPSVEELEATPTEIRTELEKLSAESKSLLDKLESTLKHVRYRFHGDILVGRMKATNIYAKKFNDRAFDLNNILSVTKNQTISGAIRLKTLSADALTVPSINGVYVKDLLLRNKSLQEVTGEHTVRSMKARNFALGRLGKLNGTLFSSIRGVGNEDGNVISQRKTLARVTLRNLQVDNINGEPAERWLAKILPNVKDFNPEEALNFTHLNVEHLMVANINGVSWENYLMGLERSDRNGFASAMENTEVRDLRAKRINGIDTEYFLTKDTPQEVRSTISVSSATLPSVKANIFIGGRGLSPFQNGGHDKLSASLAVSEVVFRNAATISGKSVRFDDLSKTYWFKSLSQDIDTPITFASQVTAAALQTKRINNISVERFATTEESIAFQGRMVFDDAEVMGNIAASSGATRNINLEELYRSAVKRKGENRLKGKKVFSGKVFTKHFTLQSPNGVDLGFAIPGATEILRVQQVEIMGNVTVKNGVRLEYLNGVNFNDVMKTHVRIDGSNILQQARFSSLSVKETEIRNINGVGAGSMFSSGKKGGRLRVVIKGNLDVPELNVTNVNGIALNEYLNKVVLRNGTTSIIKGRKQFHRLVTVKGNLDGVLNGYDLVELEKKALSKSKPQMITGAFVVDVLNVDNAEGDVIDGVSSDDLLFEDGPLQTVRSDVVFQDFAIAGNIKSQNFMDGCDLLRMSSLKVSEMRKLGKVDVMGNVTWKADRGGYKGISYLYKNAVTKHDEQVVEGSVTFRESTAFDKLTTKRNINDVDLEFIVKDAIYRSLSVQEISQDVTFRGKITANNILIENNMIVDSINGIDILDFGQRLVRNNAETEVRGKKKFLSAFTTLSLTADAVNGAKTNAIIFCENGGANGSISFPEATFQSVKTLKDLNVLRVNQVNLSNLLQERLSKSKPGRVNGTLRVEAPVSIKGDAGISRINDLRMRDTILISGETDAKSITGEIEINSTLSGVEMLEVGTLNGRNVTEMNRRALLNVEDTVINGNIVFKENVEFSGNVDVLQGIADCETKTVRPMQLPVNIGNAETSYSRKIDDEIGKIENTSTSLIKPIIFIDLHAKSRLNLGFVKVQKIISTRQSDNLEFDVYGLSNDERCQPRGECYCNGQKNVAMSSISDVVVSDSVFPVNYKYFDEGLGVEIIVTASTSTYDSRCDHGTDANGEYATLNWRRKNATRDDGRREMDEDKTNTKNSLRFNGHVNDVKFFKMAHSIFVIIAFYIRPVENKMSRLNIIVHEFDGRTETMEQIQEMEMNGVEALNVFWTPKGVVLVAGNGYDSESFADSVDSAIYRFSDTDNQFQLLRSVKTHGILDIASIREEKESFIFLVQKQSWPFVVLKYNPEYDNYYFSQKLYADQSRVKSNFLSAAAFTTARAGYEGDIFVGIVHSRGGFRLYKYKHIEGFVEEVHQEQKNLEMLMPFRIGSRQYLLAASSGDHSLIYEVAQQGILQGAPLSRRV